MPLGIDEKALDQKPLTRLEVRSGFDVMRRQFGDLEPGEIECAGGIRHHADSFDGPHV